jgi:hypothetical protein
MNVVMSGSEVNAAMDGYRAAVLRELREEVAGMDLPGRDLRARGSRDARAAVLAAIDRRLDLIPSGGIAEAAPGA